MSRVRDVVRVVLAAAVGLAILSGCVRAEGDLTVNGTGSDAPDTVSGTMLVAVSDDWAIAQGTDPATLSDAIAEELSGIGDSGITGEPFEDGDYTGTTLTFDEVPIERLAQATDNTLAITRDGDSYVVSGDLSGLNNEDGETPPWSVHLALTLPEDVTSHNGSLEGRTVTWDLDQSSADTTLAAVASVGPIPWYTHVPWWLVALTLLVGVGALVAWRLSRRARASGDGSGGGRSGAGGGSAGGGSAGGAVQAMRERQARARGTSTSSLDDMLGPKSKQVQGGRTGAKPRARRPGRR